MKGWIGVDLDGTLAEYHGWSGESFIGCPIPAMVERVKKWIKEGEQVKIFTARVANDPEKVIEYFIANWCLEHIGTVLEVTCKKDYGMIELWDDRAIRIVTNTGKRCCGDI